MKQVYLDTILLIERLHRQFLEVVKAELDRLGIEDINNVQSLILSHIGDEDSGRRTSSMYTSTIHLRTPESS